MKTKLLTLAACGALLLSFESHALIYKWTDDEGNVHYTQDKPLGQDSEIIKPKIRHIKKSTAPAQTFKFTPISSKKEKAEEESLEQRNCKIAKHNYETLKTHSRIRVSDAKGENRVVPEDEKQAKIKEAKMGIEKYCK